MGDKVSGVGNPGVGGHVVVGVGNPKAKPDPQKGTPDTPQGQKTTNPQSVHPGNGLGLQNKPDKPAKPDKPDKPGKPDKPASVQQLKADDRLARSRVDNSNGSKPNPPGQQTQRGGDGRDGDKGTGNLKTNHPSETRNENNPRDNPPGWQRNHNDSDGGDLFRTQGNGHDHGHGQDRGSGALDFLKLKDNTHALTSTLTDYLHGLSDGAKLKPEMRQVLNDAARLLGDDFVRNLNPTGKDGEKVFKIIEHALEHASHELEKAYRQGGESARPAEEFVRRAVTEIAGAAQLERYFKQAEKTGGNVVRQAESAVAHMLYGERGDGVERIGNRSGGDFYSRQSIYPGEVLRDLRAGAFLPPQESNNPFPLTGRARVVTEMMELMRTLDAMGHAATLAGADARGELSGAKGAAEAALLLAYLKGHAATGDASLEALDKLLAAILPSLPGRVGRVEMLRLVAALEGLLADAEGRLLSSKEGIPLRLEQLLWFGTLGATAHSTLMSETSQARLSSLLVYGFDAVYSVIGFDGRTLNPPHFVAVQSQVNGSELEWVFGQPPLSEGWMRSLIERLKDSALADHNLLGEMLEEALAEGRFHAVLVSGKVQEGEPVAGSSSVARLLPGASAQTAFA